jgi:hypothetical protein
MIIIYLLLGKMFYHLTAAFPLFFFSIILIVDSLVLMKFKRNFTYDKSKPTQKLFYTALKFSFYFELFIGIPMMIASAIVVIVSGIGIK